MVLDLARFDRVRGMFLNDLGELCKLLEGRWHMCLEAYSRLIPMMMTRITDVEKI